MLPGIRSAPSAPGELSEHNHIICEFTGLKVISIMPPVTPVYSFFFHVLPESSLISQPGPSARIWMRFGTPGSYSALKMLAPFFFSSVKPFKSIVPI